jgi:hypothetical protein
VLITCDTEGILVRNNFNGSCPKIVNAVGCELAALKLVFAATMAVAVYVPAAVGKVAVGP